MKQDVYILHRSKAFISKSKQIIIENNCVIIKKLTLIILYKRNSRDLNHFFFRYNTKYIS